MSRVSTLERLYAKPQKNALEFDYDALWAPPIYSLLTYEDVNELYRIATSVKLSGNINKKYQLLDTVMGRRGFRPDHKGTNRVTYRFLEDPRFLAKVAVDRVGIEDSPAEYRNQDFLKPFCCKIFEVDSTGVIAFVERVNPITSLQEFASVSDDIFNMMITKIIGKYVVDDLGTTKFMNYGIRMRNGCAFGPVVIDFPYVYELDGAKLICREPQKGTNLMCGGEIDYDAGMNHLICKKCGREYSAKDLKKHDGLVLKCYGESDRRYTMRARIINDDGTVVMDSGRTTRQTVSAEEMRMINTVDNNQPVTKVSRTHKSKKKRKESAIDINRRFYQERVDEYYRKMEELKQGPFNPVIKPRVTKATVHQDDKPKEPEFTTPETTVVNRNVSTRVAVTHYQNEAAIREAIPELQNGVISKSADELEEDTVDLAGAIVEGIKEAMSEEVHCEYPEDEVESDETEDDTSDDEAEPDYSYSYYPTEEEPVEEDEEEDDKYQEYADKFEREDRKKYSKKQRRGRNDMSEY